MLIHLDFFLSFDRLFSQKTCILKSSKFNKRIISSNLDLVFSFAIIKLAMKETLGFVQLKDSKFEKKPQELFLFF